MPDYQTSPVGEEAERAAFEAEVRKVNDANEIMDRWSGGQYKHHGMEGRWQGWLMARRAAPALDASGLPPLPRHHGYIAPHKVYTAEQVRQAQRDAVASRDAEIADLRAQLARQSDQSNMQKAHVAPTQPKAQVGSINTPEFRMLEADFVKESVELSTKDHHADNTGLYTARTALIDYIDAWAGSRAGDAEPDGWKLVPVEPTVEMIAANGTCDIPQGQEMLSSDARATWAAMLAAAPAPGKQAGNDQEGAS